MNVELKMNMRTKGDIIFLVNNRAYTIEAEIYMDRTTVTDDEHTGSEIDLKAIDRVRARSRPQRWRRRGMSSTVHKRGGANAS